MPAYVPDHRWTDGLADCIPYLRRLTYNKRLGTFGFGLVLTISHLQPNRHQTTPHQIVRFGGPAELRAYKS